MALEVDIQTRISGTHTKSSDLTAVAESISINAGNVKLTDGSGSNQANKFYSDTRSAAASAETFDLTSLTDAFGAALSLSKVRTLRIYNKSTTTGEDLTIGGNFIASSVLGGTTPTLTIEPGGVFQITAPIDGFTVTDTTADTISVDPGANTISFDIVVVGVGS